MTTALTLSPAQRLSLAAFLHDALRMPQEVDHLEALAAEATAYEQLLMTLLPALPLLTHPLDFDFPVPLERAWCVRHVRRFYRYEDGLQETPIQDFRAPLPWVEGQTAGAITGSAVLLDEAGSIHLVEFRRYVHRELPPQPFDCKWSVYRSASALVELADVEAFAQDLIHTLRLNGPCCESFERALPPTQWLPEGAAAATLATHVVLPRDGARLRPH